MIGRRLLPLLAALTLMLALGFAATPPSARAEYGTFKTLDSFCPTSACVTGWHPYGGMVLDKHGNVYGTTLGGGSHATNLSLYHTGGAVFTLTKANNFSETAIYSFCAQSNCTDGLGPQGDAAVDSEGRVYVAASLGGATQNSSEGFGTIVQITPNSDRTEWTPRVIHVFDANQSSSDGHIPIGGLIFDEAGNLYGTTMQGGENGNGTVFVLKPNHDGSAWIESILYSFCPKRDKKNVCEDGSEPLATLAMDQMGNLYGTTQQGGAACPFGSCGTVFMLELNKRKTAGTLTVLHKFCADGKSDCGDGMQPQSGVLVDPKGKLIFGTTFIGGDKDGSEGTIFMLKRMRKTHWTEKIIHNFTGPENTLYSGVIQDGDGDLFGVTYENTGTDGAVFELRPNKKMTKWSLHILHEFCPALVNNTCPDGSNPISRLTLDKADNLYGTTFDGGVHQGDGGSVFELVK